MGEKWTNKPHISETVQDRRFKLQLGLLTHRKWHESFPLVSMTMNDVIALIVLNFAEFRSFWGQLYHSD